MMIKFLARGTGSAVADYLTRKLSPAHEQDRNQDQDPEKTPEKVKVLRGNPHQVAAVADGLEFEHKYTSGVLAWALSTQTASSRSGHLSIAPTKGPTTG